MCLSNRPIIKNKETPMSFLDQIKQPRPYLATTARHIMINQAKRKKIEESYLKNLAEQPEHLQPPPEQLFIILEKKINF